jgi:hypothetical protein
MRCRKIEKLFSEYILGDISPEERVFLEDHLDSCLSCRESLTAFRELSNIILDSSDRKPSDLYFDSLPKKVTAKIRTTAESSPTPFFSLSRFWWKPASAFAAAAFILLMFFNVLIDGTTTPAGALPDFTEIEQSEPYSEFVSTLEDTDTSLVLDHFEITTSTPTDTTVWHSDSDNVNTMLLFTDEEQDEIFDTIKEQMS